MRFKLALLGVALALVLVWAVWVHATTLDLEEADLNPGGEVYEINLDAQGDLYITDSEAGEVWQVDASGAYTVYQLAGVVVDAKPDSAGDIWFTDAAIAFGRIDRDDDTLTTWTLTGAQNLGGLAFDGAGRVWLSQAFGSDIYRFDPSTSQVCTYTVGAPSDYVLYQDGQLWLANWGNDRIYRLNPAGDSVTWWQIVGGNTRPVGLAMDGEGNLWWADSGLRALVRLEPISDRMTSYVLPVGTSPQMIEISQDGVWYTEIGTRTFGLLDPLEATGVTTTLAVQTSSVVSACGSLGGGTMSAVATRTGNLVWSSESMTPIGAADGWQVYQLAVGAVPYGIASSSGYLWMSDRGNQKLLRFSASYPAIVLKKQTNGQDADTAPGPSIRVGDPVTWTYEVENTGSVTLSDIGVTDDQEGVVSCPYQSLAPHQSMTCTLAGSAVAGQYSNAATVTGTPPGGPDPVTAQDASHYFGVDLAIVLEKHTNGQDADTAPGPSIRVGDPVTWTYAVENTGNVALTGITVVDDNGTPDDSLDDYTCLITSLPAGVLDDTTCSQIGVAMAGQYGNLGTVTAFYSDIQVLDTDPSHYLGHGEKIAVFLPLVIRSSHP